jgi:hypothetical protein
LFGGVKSRQYFFEFYKTNRTTLPSYCVKRAKGSERRTNDEDEKTDRMGALYPYGTGAHPIRNGGGN